LALLALRDALAGNDTDQVLAGLRDTRTRFSAIAAGSAGERTDAEVWGLVIDLLLAFHHATSSAVASIASRLRREILPRYLAHLGARPGWRAGRADVELEWLALAESLTEAAKRLDEPAWRTPAETTARVLEVYRADRTIRVVARPGDTPGLPGVRTLLAPRVEAAFVRERGLRALLDHWLEDAAEQIGSSDDVAIAEQLRAVVNAAPSQPSSAEGKAPGGLGPHLRALLGDDTAQLPVADILAIIEARLADRAAADAASDEYVVDEAFRQLHAALVPAKDLVGQIADHYLLLVRTLLRFLRARLDPPRREAPTAYLYQHQPPPHERALGEDLTQWLNSGDIPV